MGADELESRNHLSLKELEAERGGRKVRKLLAGTFVATALTFGAGPQAFAQSTTTDDVDEVQNTVENAAESDDSGKWGLLGLAGLIGLAGLAGLKRRDRDNVGAYRNADGSAGTATTQTGSTQVR